MTNYNFLPDPGGTQNITPTSSSQNITVVKGKNYRLFNGSNTTCFIRLNNSGGTITAASTTADMPLAASDIVYIDSDLNDTISIISTGTPTGSFYVTSGRGYSGS